MKWKLHSRPSHLQEYMEPCSPGKTKLWQQFQQSICSGDTEHVSRVHFTTSFAL